MKAWDNFLLLQEIELGASVVQKWLRPLKVHRFDARNLYLVAEDSFQVSWFEEHIRDKVKTRLVNNNNQQIKVILTLKNTIPEEKRKIKKLKSPDTKEFKLEFDHLDPNCTFDHFIISESNLLAFKLLCKITNYDPVSKKCIQSGTELAAFNPIYIHGTEGVGKTHLMMSTAHALRAQGFNTLYVRAETFTEHVVTAIRASEMGKFRQAYRNIDILLIDDVHIFSRKGATQEELFHTFNTLHMAGKQIVLTSKCSPSELQSIEPRLVSRFEWGIVLPLEKISEQEREQLLQKKSEALNFEIHPKVARYLLDTFKSSTKSLIRALEALILRSHLEKHPPSWAYKKITVPYTKETIKDLIDEEQEEKLSSDKIINHIAHYFGIHTDDLLGNIQKREFTLPRQFAMFFCRDSLKIPYTKIGDLFDRDHSTVMSSVKLIQKSIDASDTEIMRHHHAIQKKLQSK